MKGFDCGLLGCDDYQSPAYLAMNMEYIEIADSLKESDIVSLHCPLTLDTKYLISEKTINLMKRGSMLINTASLVIKDS